MAEKNTCLENIKRYDGRDDVKFIKFGTLRWTRHVMRLEESDSAQKLVCTKPGRNGDVGEADRS
jgi:hypothetical protein